MLLVRGDEVEGAVFVLGVVVGDEVAGPFLGVFECGEAVWRIGGMVFCGAKEAFCEGVIVADAGP